MQHPSLSESLEAYLGIGSVGLPYPTTYEDRLVELVGGGAPALKAQLDSVLDPLMELPEAWASEPPGRLAELATARAVRLHPEFGAGLCAEIGSFFAYTWK